MSWQIYTYINVHTFRHSREFSPKETLYRNWSGCQQSYEIEHLIEQLSNIRLLSEEQQLKQEAQLEHRQSIKQQLTERFRELRACVDQELEIQHKLFKQMSVESYNVIEVI